MANHSRWRFPHARTSSTTADMLVYYQDTVDEETQPHNLPLLEPDEAHSLSPHFIRTLPASRGANMSSGLQDAALDAPCPVALEDMSVAPTSSALSPYSFEPSDFSLQLSIDQIAHAIAMDQEPLSPIVDLDVSKDKDDQTSQKMVMTLLLGPPLEAPKYPDNTPSPPLSPSFFAPRDAPLPPTSASSYRFSFLGSNIAITCPYRRLISPMLKGNTTSVGQKLVTFRPHNKNKPLSIDTNSSSMGASDIIIHHKITAGVGGPVSTSSSGNNSSSSKRRNSSSSESTDSSRSSLSVATNPAVTSRSHSFSSHDNDLTDGRVTGEQQPPAIESNERSYFDFDSDDDEASASKGKAWGILRVKPSTKKGAGRTMSNTVRPSPSTLFLRSISKTMLPAPRDAPQSTT